MASPVQSRRQRPRNASSTCGVVAAPETLRGRLRGKSTTEMIRTRTRLRIDGRWDVMTRETATVLRTLARRITSLNDEACDHQRAILQLVRSWRPDLLAGTARSTPSSSPDSATTGLDEPSERPIRTSAAHLGIDGTAIRYEVPMRPRRPRRTIRRTVRRWSPLRPHPTRGASTCSLPIPMAASRSHPTGTPGCAVRPRPGARCTTHRVPSPGPLGRWRADGRSASTRRNRTPDAPMPPDGSRRS